VVGDTVLSPHKQAEEEAGGLTSVIALWFRNGSAEVASEDMCSGSGTAAALLPPLPPR
jgi:hypothetical protein